MAKAESVTVPITSGQLLSIDERCPNLAASLFNKLLSFTTGVSSALVESASHKHNGMEAWRILSRRFNPATPQKCVQLMTSIVTMKVSHNNEVLHSLLKWETMIASLARDYKETPSEKMKVALMVRILPQSLQERIHEHLDRLTSYKEVYDKVVSLVQSSSKYGNDEMDCSWVGENSGYEYEEQLFEPNTLEEINALGAGGCYRCGGFGHIARECSTP